MAKQDFFAGFLWLIVLAAGAVLYGEIILKKGQAESLTSSEQLQQLLESLPGVNEDKDSLQDPIQQLLEREAAAQEALLRAEARCLALNLYHEARGEGVLGMVAVALVTQNRANVGFRGQKTVCGVVYDPYQFSWTHELTPAQQQPTDPAAWRTAQEIAQQVLQAEDGGKFAAEVQLLNILLGDADHYHADYVDPYWANHMDGLVQVGRHIFYRG